MRLVVDGRLLLDLVVEAVSPLDGAQAVDGFIARECNSPRERFAALRIVHRGLVPDLHEDILQHVLRSLLIVQNAIGGGKQNAREAFVKLLETLPVTAPDPLDEVDLQQQIGGRFGFHGKHLLNAVRERMQCFCHDLAGARDVVLAVCE